MRFEEFESCLAWWNKREESERAWKVRTEDLLKYDAQGSLISVNLDIKNPRAKEDFQHLPPEQLVEDILQKEHKIIGVINEIKQHLHPSR